MTLASPRPAWSRLCLATRGGRALTPVGRPVPLSAVAHFHRIAVPFLFAMEAIWRAIPCSKPVHRTLLLAASVMASASPVDLPDVTVQAHVVEEGESDLHTHTTSGSRLELSAPFTPPPASAARRCANATTAGCCDAHAGYQQHRLARQWRHRAVGARLHWPCGDHAVVRRHPSSTSAPAP